MFVAAFRVNDQYKLDNYLIYSDDEGQTWEVSELACKGGDEAKVIVMPDESILMSLRNQPKGDRIFKLSYDNGVTWKATNDFSGLHDPACNGAPLFMEQNGIKTLGELVQKMQLPRSPLREQVVDAMTTNETLWFRDTYPFEVLKNKPDFFDSHQAELPNPMWVKYD